MKSRKGKTSNNSAGRTAEVQQRAGLAVSHSILQRLAEADLKPEERIISVGHFKPEEFAEASFWASIGRQTPPRFQRPLEGIPDSILTASEDKFLILLREGLEEDRRNFLIEHCVGHLLYGHIRLSDDVAHWDVAERLLNGQHLCRWDSQVKEHFSGRAPKIIETFLTEGFGEVLARLQEGEIEQPWMSAGLLYQTYIDEVVEVPQGLAESARLFPHQTRGIAEIVARLRRFNASVLADSVGLGKTRTTCAVVRMLRDVGDGNRAATTAAILTPRKLERNWRKEMAVVGLQEGRDIVLVNKDIFKRLSPKEAARALSGIGLVVVEEAHQDLRNPGSRFHRNLRDSVGVKPGLLVTATPWNNRRGDIFSILSPFVRPQPGIAEGAFECFKKGFRTGRKEFEEDDDVFRRVYASTVLQRTRRQLRELGDAGVYYAPREPRLDVVPYTRSQQAAFRTLLQVVEALRLPYFNPVRHLTAERDAEWRLSGTYRFFLLKRAESSMAALRITLHGMRARAEKLREELTAVKDNEAAVARWLAGCYNISEEVIEEVLDSAHEGGLVEERVSRPRQRRALRLIEEAKAKGRLRPLRRQLIKDCEQDMRLLDKVEKEFAALFDADPKLAVVKNAVRRAVAEKQKVLLVSQFADTAFTVYKSLLVDDDVRQAGVGLVMSTAKGGEAPVQSDGRKATREQVIRQFAPGAWAANEVETGRVRSSGLLPGERELTVLVGTDTLSVGQNLQDARTILHLDLTWNPMVLEQRIGRLDRPRHESDDAPIRIRYFLNLDLIEAELQLKKTIDARLEATYQDTSFDDEILPGYFELIETMRRLRNERAEASDIAREVEAMLEELAASRPPEAADTNVESRRAALERLRNAMAEHSLPEPTPPLVLTLGETDAAQDTAEMAAQVELQTYDNNGVKITRPTTHLLTVEVPYAEDAKSGTTQLDDLSWGVNITLRPPYRRGAGAVPPVESLLPLLQVLDREVQRVAAEIRDERNRRREKRREVRERIRPPWLSPLIGRVRSFLESLPETQYEGFLARFNISDESLGAWLDALAGGVNLDDAEMVERLRKLENSPASILEEFEALRELIVEEETGDTDADVERPPAQLSFELEPFVNRIEARLTNLRINVPA
jgi:hypothetical protein